MKRKLALIAMGAVLMAGMEVGYSYEIGKYAVDPASANRMSGPFTSLYRKISDSR
jgi:hypothetical protein